MGVYMGQATAAATKHAHGDTCDVLCAGPALPAGVRKAPCLRDGIQGCTC